MSNTADNPLAPTFKDPQDFDLERQKLARRRKIAESLIATEADAPRMLGNWVLNTGPMGGVAASIARGRGEHDMSKVEDQEKLLSANEAHTRSRIVEGLGAKGTKPQLYDPVANPGTGPLVNGEVPLDKDEEQARRFKLYGEGMGVPSLRKTLESQLGAELKQPLQEELLGTKLENAQSLMDAKNAAMLKGIDARIAGQKELRAMPTIHITNSGNPSGPASFGGTAPQIGIDPRNDQPIYRHTKSGQLFSYGPDGQPVIHNGAIAPKPPVAKEPTESERGAAGYLGRMEAAEKNLGDAKPFNLPTQVGLDRAPSATNFVLTPEQQVQRQQQEDWVRAKLRKESGAVIGDEEMAREIRTYFPMAGDKPQVIQQKAQSRAQALEQMRSSAGRSKPTEAAPVPPAAQKRRKYNPATGDFE